MDYIKIEQDLIDDHGIWLRARKTSLGHLTIGVGYHDSWIKDNSEMSLEQVGRLLSDGISKAIAQTSKIFGRPFMDTITDPQQRALVCIAYSGALEYMGEFVEAVKERNWAQAVIEYDLTGHATAMHRRAERIKKDLMGAKNETRE